MGHGDVGFRRRRGLHAHHPSVPRGPLRGHHRAVRDGSRVHLARRCDDRVRLRRQFPLREPGEDHRRVHTRCGGLRAAQLRGGARQGRGEDSELVAPSPGPGTDMHRRGGVHVHGLWFDYRLHLDRCVMLAPSNL